MRAAVKAEKPRSSSPRTSSSSSEGDTKAFPSQLRDIIPPACSGSSPRQLLLGYACNISPKSTPGMHLFKDPTHAMVVLTGFHFTYQLHRQRHSQSRPLSLPSPLVCSFTMKRNWDRHQSSRHHLWPHLPPRDGQTDLNIYIDTNTGSGIWSMLALGLIGCFVSTLLVWSVLNCVKHFFLWKIKKHTSVIICEKCANLFVLTVMWIVFIACSTFKQQWLSQSALEAGTKRNC